MLGDGSNSFILNYSLTFNSHSTCSINWRLTNQKRRNYSWSLQMVREGGDDDDEKARHSVFHCSLMSHLLGLIAGGSLVLALAMPSQGRLALYVLALSLFHFMEFLLTARYHPDMASCDGKKGTLEHAFSWWPRGWEKPFC